jgi:hypothetical protein
LSSLAILNPLTGLQSFGIVPSLKLSGVMLPEAPIHLPLGRHIGPNKGFGARHIWAEHRIEMERSGHISEADVPLYVLSIIRVGTPLYFEGAIWQQTRLMAVRSATGTAVVEFRERRDASVWSVVTAFSGTKTHGSRVGTVR